MKKYAGPLLAAPGMLLMFIILIAPLGFSIYCSVYKCDYLQFKEMVGIENYFSVMQNKEFMQAFVRTFYISFLALVIAMVPGILLALWINRSRGMFAYALQIIGLVPWVTSMVVSSLLWKWLLHYDLGLINYIANMLGIGSQDILNGPKTAVYGVILVMAWRTVGYSMIMVLAGLKAIPLGLEEAAAVDGCSSAQVFRYIRVPLLKTPLLISSIVLTLSNFNNLTVPQSLTSGGPGTSSYVITLSMYMQGFKYYRFGIASAIAIMVFIVNVVLVVLYVKAVRYDV